MCIEWLHGKFVQKGQKLRGRRRRQTGCDCLGRRLAVHRFSGVSYVMQSSAGLRRAPREATKWTLLVLFSMILPCLQSGWQVPIQGMEISYIFVFLLIVGI